MIVFELTMPHVNTWNGHWSGEDKLYVRTRSEREVPETLWGREFRYRWSDGWEACITVRQMDARAARRLEQRSSGFLGYDWMITSLIKDWYIHTIER